MRDLLGGWLLIVVHNAIFQSVPGTVQRGVFLLYLHDDLQQCIGPLCIAFPVRDHQPPNGKTQGSRWKLHLHTNDSVHIIEFLH